MDKGITSITVRTCLLIFLSGKGVLRLRSSSPNNIEVDVHDRSAKRQKLLENNPFLDLEAVAEDEEDPEEEDEEDNDQFIDDGMYLSFCSSSCYSLILQATMLDPRLHLMLSFQATICTKIQNNSQKSSKADTPTPSRT